MRKAWIAGCASRFPQSRGNALTLAITFARGGPLGGSIALAVVGILAGWQAIARTASYVAVEAPKPPSERVKISQGGEEHVRDPLTNDNGKVGVFALTQVVGLRRLVKLFQKGLWVLTHRTPILNRFERSIPAYGKNFEILHPEVCGNGGRIWAVATPGAGNKSLVTEAANLAEAKKARPTGMLGFRAHGCRTYRLSTAEQKPRHAELAAAFDLGATGVRWSTDWSRR